MRHPIPRLALVLATAFLAGCLSDPMVPTTADQTPAYVESTAPEAPDDTPTSTPTGDAPRPTGPPAAVGEHTGPRPTMAEPAPAPMTSIPIAFEGRTPSRVCRGYPYDSTTCVTLTRGDNTTVSVDAIAKPLLLTGNLIWDASTPSQGHLVVHLMVHDGDEYVYSEGPWSRTFGESPLPISFDLSDYAGKKLALAISADECMLETSVALNCALAGSARFELAQEFSFRGKLIGWN